MRWSSSIRIIPEAGARGYICFWTLEGELTIQNIATHPEERRRGGRGRMMDAAFAEARRAGCAWAYLEVRPSNDAALHLYCKWGSPPWAGAPVTTKTPERMRS